jgi:soluble lytic murein transglycosylase-like protein
MLVAVAQVESRFVPNAVSSKNARGLLQVMPTTGASLKLNVNDPATNVLAGARYLRMLLDRYKRTNLALAAYNAGPTRIDSENDVLGPISMRYVANVEARWAALAGCS